MMIDSAQNVNLQYLRSRLGRVCVAITGTTPQEMLERAGEAVRENTFVEFRLDYLPKPLAAMPKLKDFLELHREATAIATCRRQANGGKFAGSATSEVEVLTKAAAAGFHMVDVELQTAEAMKPADWKKLRATGAAILVSYHDFKTTKDLQKVYARIEPLHPDFIKIVSTARSLADNVTMMRFSGVERRRGKCGRHLHGRLRHHQPGAGFARGEQVYIRLRQRRRGNRARTDCGAYPDGNLPGRSGGCGNARLWRGWKPGAALAVADHDEHGFSSGNRECRLPGAADGEDRRPAAVDSGGSRSRS